MNTNCPRYISFSQVQLSLVKSAERIYKGLSGCIVDQRKGSVAQAYACELARHRLRKIEADRFARGGELTHGRRSEAGLCILEMAIAVRLDFPTAWVPQSLD
jgi:hypothetical protein